MKTVLALLLLLALTPSAFAQKFEFVGKAEVDYGTIEKGSDGVREVKFTNKGFGPLTLSGRSSCGCLVPNIPAEPIMPGETKIISMKYDTMRPGPFMKFITLTTNDRERPEVRLTVVGNVKAPAGAEPAESTPVKSP